MQGIEGVQVKNKVELSLDNFARRLFRPASLVLVSTLSSSGMPNVAPKTQVMPVGRKDYCGKLPLPFMDEALEFIYQAAKGPSPAILSSQQLGPHPRLCQSPEKGQSGKRSIRYICRKAN